MSSETVARSLMAGVVRRGGRGRRAWEWYLRSPMSFRSISLVYVWAAVFVVFSLWVPDTFLAASTWRSLAAEQAVTTILALAVVIALAAGVFDLSVAAVLGAAAMLIAHLMVDLGWAPVPAAAVTLVGAVAVGAVSGTAVVVFRVNPFIATLGMSSILAAFISSVTDNQQVIGLPASFTDWATFKLLGIQGAFWIALAIAAIVWFVLEHRPVGRHMYATGGNPDAARLAGVRTGRVVFGTMVIAAVVAGIAGIVVTSRIGSGSPTIGPAYLLPAFAAAFLGSTQIKPGRFNVLGTLIAVYALATSVKGLQLAGAPFWLPDLFNGVALVVAVAVSVHRRRLTPSAAPDSAPPVVRRPLTLREAARGGIEDLRDRTGETVSLVSIPAGEGDGKVIEAAESRAELRVAARTGDRVPAGEVGALRAAADRIGDAPAVDALARDGIVEVSAPVRDAGRTVAILCVRAPASRVTDELRELIHEGAQATAEDISVRLHADARVGPAGA